MAALRRTPAEQHLLALWFSLREALGALEAGHLDSLCTDAQLMALVRTLSADARRLSEGLDHKLAACPVEPAPPTPPVSRPRVVLVDDDRNALQAMQQLLEDEYEVCAADNAPDAARIARESHPDAIVTDLRMPGADGMALLDLLESDRLASAPPLLVVSGDAEPENRTKVLERGAFDFLPKPLDMGELKARLHRAVRHGQDLKKAQRLQLTDDLTGLYNRRAFNLALQNALVHDAERRQPTALALIDQDGLKEINDTFGHAAGDRAIQTVAAALKLAGRASDSVVRLGGDEFAVVMPATGADGARRMMERVALELGQRPIEVAAGRVITLRASWGVACSGGKAVEPSTLIATADARLYEMKRARGTRSGRDAGQKSRPLTPPLPR